MDIKNFLVKIIVSAVVGIGLAYLLSGKIDQNVIYITSVVAALVVYSVLDNYKK
jgi:hypothetical protein